ncbi:hypothetical protein CP532_0660 [Ophiocordyceps camponoti-leonardi (nom. inval.)]|nr:hypothetical protein CP532_0660 [Ophiocordyceps camponoti-leonardi (nom. inval.)]
MMLIILSILLLSLTAKSQEINPTIGFNPILRPRPHESIVAGSSYIIRWDTSPAYAVGSVAICLIGGKSQATQEKLANITDAVPSSAGRYTWSVPSTLGTKPVYGLVLRWNQDPSVFQYSNPFHIVPVAKISSTTTTTSSTPSSSTPSNTALVVMSPPSSAVVQAHQTAGSPPSLSLSLHLLLTVLLAFIVLG